jgi:hypothetical protein
VGRASSWSVLLAGLAASLLDAPAAQALPPARLVLDSGRPEPRPRDPGAIRLQLHGEYQARLTVLGDLPLEPPPGHPDADSLGQNLRLQHWLRNTLALEVQDWLSLVTQADVPYGMIAGHENRWVGAADEPLDDLQPMRATLRWLYAEWDSDVARVRIGQQPSHWGLGILENDGDHPTVFGDYHGGDRVLRAELVLIPGRPASGWRLRVAGDVVAQDQLAKLADDEVALRAVASVRYGNEDDSGLGVWCDFRHQRRTSTVALGSDLHADSDLWTVDSAGQLRAAIPGTMGWVFAQYEVALRTGRTNAVRTLEEPTQRVLGYGGVVRVGAARIAGPGKRPWADLVAALEWGWASGDADPYDATYRRFDLDPNHNVGLILFDEVLYWKTARAATRAEDPAYYGRSLPAGDELVSNGSVFGATYLYPNVVWRPRREFDLRLAALIAQSTADLVDPVSVATSGNYRNFDGGSPRSHDLGLELDAGIEYRLPLEPDMTLALGAQGGVLMPGRAFADASGTPLPTQALAVTRLGLQY